MKNRATTPQIVRLAALASLIALLLNSCTLSLVDPSGILPPTPSLPFPIPPTATPQPHAEVTFEVSLPSPLLPGESLVLSIVDEVTGLALNATNYPMQGKDALHYRLALPLPVNSVVKYRYLRQTTLPILEDNSADQAVRYRMVYVTGPLSVQDEIAGWSDSQFSGQTGRIFGQVVNASDGAPIPDILVAAGGLQTLTDSSGVFSLEGLLPGTHNLVAYALDGMYQTFQQGALVVADKLTPVKVTLAPAALVNVVFAVIVPSNTVPTAPIRLAGNLYQLGNTFGDLEGGLSTVATRMPVLTPLPDGRFTLSLMLPAGADIRYKYSLGDGFWNAEHRHNGEFVVRQLIVPQVNSLVEDVVETWQAGPSAPILFEVIVPVNTPVTDVISMQFNPYGWTVPIPMWPLGNNRWVYMLFSPLNMLGSFEYRYCRNDQCGSADDLATPPGQRGRLVATSLTPQDLQDTVNGWNWLPPSAPGTLVGLQVTPRASGFWAGVEFQSHYDPSWQALMPQALQNVQALGSNWVILTPTWTYRRTAPLVFAPLPGYDPLWADTNETVSRARALNLNVALFPSANFPASADDWWSAAPRDINWWDAWFARYQAFAVYYADLATQSGAQSLILGGEWLTPALPGGRLANGVNSNAPTDADARWRNLLAEARKHYAGSIYWALPYPAGLQTAPDFIKELDGIYLLWYAPLSGSAAPSVEEMQAQAGQLLDRDILLFQASLSSGLQQKPLVLAVAYPSVNGAASACLPDGKGACLPWTALNQPSDNECSAPDNPAFSVDMKSQADIYQALLNAVNSRAWIAGFVSRGYFPPTLLQDKSASLHGKQAADILWYWYPRLLGVVK
ncbi:MAG: hypothetical protein KJ606_08945 [Chloroflexi bacterium]|nr:hypothetical protein [Chloroflexota bacterium]